MRLPPRYVGTADTIDEVERATFFSFFQGDDFLFKIYPEIIVYSEILR